MGVQGHVHSCEPCDFTVGFQVQVGGQEMMEVEQHDGVGACKELPRARDESVRSTSLMHAPIQAVPFHD